MSLRSLLRFCVLMAGVASATTGCVGFLVGYTVDVATEKSVVPTTPEAVDFEPGTRVTVSLKHGGQLSAKFLGVEPFTPEEYAARYGTARQNLAARSRWVPPLGGTVRVRLTTGDDFTAAFEGIDRDGVSVRPAGEPASRTLPASGVHAIEEDGQPPVAGVALDSLLTAGSLPGRTALVLDMPGGPTRLPLSAIARIRHRGKTWRWVGAGLEAATWILVTALTFEMNMSMSY